MVNRDKSITDNLSPSGRVDSIADRGNVFSAGAGSRMDHNAERDACNFSEVSRAAQSGGDPMAPFYGRSYDHAGYLAEHAERKHTGGVGGSTFERGSVLIQPPNDGPKR